MQGKNDFYLKLLCVKVGGAARRQKRVLISICILESNLRRTIVLNCP